MSLAADSRVDKRKRALQQVASVLFVAGLLALLHGRNIVICPARRLFHIPCPACGTTRAVFALIRGDVLGAFAYQPLMTLVVMFVGIGWGVNLVRLWCGKDVLCPVPCSGFRAKLFWSAFLILLLLNWAYVLWRGN